MGCLWAKTAGPLKTDSWAFKVALFALSVFCALGKCRVRLTRIEPGSKKACVTATAQLVP